MAREIKTFNANEVIFKEGDLSNCMYDIHFGQVGIYANYGTEQEKQLTVLNADEFFGEMGMIDACARSATAVALEDGTKVEVITAENFSSYFNEKPAKVLMIMQHMSQRIRGLTNDYLEACRAITETVEGGHIEEEKRSGLKAKLQKFIDAYAESAAYLNEDTSYRDNGYMCGLWIL